MTKRANQWANLTTHHQSDLVLPLANHTESHPGDITKRETLLSLGRQKHNMSQFDTKSIGCLRQSHCISGWQLATGWLHQSLLRGWSGVVVNKCKQDKQVCFFCSPPHSAARSCRSSCHEALRVAAWSSSDVSPQVECECGVCELSLSVCMVFPHTHSPSRILQNSDGSKWSKVKFWWFWTHHSLASTRKRLRRNMRSTRCIERVLYGFTSPLCLPQTHPAIPCVLIVLLSKLLNHSLIVPTFTPFACSGWNFHS